MFFIPEYISSTVQGLGGRCPDCQIHTGSKPNLACWYHRVGDGGSHTRYWRTRPPWISAPMERAFINALWARRGWSIKSPRF